VVEILIARNIVTDVIVGLPAAKERESWSQFKLNAVVRLVHMTRGNVSDLIAIVDVLCRRRQNRLTHKHWGGEFT